MVLKEFTITSLQGVFTKLSAIIDRIKRGTQIKSKTYAVSISIPVRPGSPLPTWTRYSPDDSQLFFIRKIDLVTPTTKGCCEILYHMRMPWSFVACQPYEEVTLKTPVLPEVIHMISYIALLILPKKLYICTPGKYNLYPS